MTTIPDPRYVVGDVPTAVPNQDGCCVVGTSQILSPLRNAEAELRRACAEMLLAGSLLLSDVTRSLSQWAENTQAKQSEERFRKALEVGREALS